MQRKIPLEVVKLVNSLVILKLMWPRAHKDRIYPIWNVINFVFILKKLNLVWIRRDKQLLHLNICMVISIFRIVYRKCILKIWKCLPPKSISFLLYEADPFSYKILISILLQMSFILWFQINNASERHIMNLRTSKNSMRMRTKDARNSIELIRVSACRII